MTATCITGHKAPEFSIPRDGGETVSLSDFSGQKVVLYFYPKDDTPGCTKESEAFRDHHQDFMAENAVIIGISKDSVKKHDKFREKYSLPFILGSDEHDKVVESYGCWIEKSMYGKKYMGIDRSTFLIDEKGIVRKEWRQVKVPGHVEEVLAAVKAL